MAVWYRIFSEIISMSIMAGILILFVIGLRLLLHRAPKLFSYLLWSIVLFRLLCPVSVPSIFSLWNLLKIPAVENHGTAMDEEIFHTESNNVQIDDTGIDITGIAGEEINNVEFINAEIISSENTDRGMAGAETRLFLILTGIWLSGMLFLAASNMFLLIRMLGQVNCSILLENNIYLTDHIRTPFAFGLVRPRIYLPSHIEEREREYIILHEQHHIQRGDLIVKTLAFMALCIHWFNPLVWIAFVLSGKDMEMSCDEAVLKKADRDIRSEYSASLLRLAVGRRIIAGLPPAFGEGDPKSRIKNVMNYKKPAVKVIIAGAVVCVCAAICLATAPQNASGTAHEDTVAAAPREETKNGEEEQGTEAANADREEQEAETISKEYEAIKKAIIEHNTKSYEEYNDTFCDFVMLDAVSDTEAVSKDNTSWTITYYGWALFEKYKISDEGIESISGSHIPVALTFEQSGDDYVLQEYWEPRDGSYYAQDIKEKFPQHIAEDGLDSQKYILVQVQSCYAQAVEKSGLDTDKVIEGIFDKMDRSLPPSSNPLDDHISSLDYRELTYYGMYTLKYCFKEFEKNQADDLQKAAMAQICRELMSCMGEALPIGLEQYSGEDWYREFRKSAMELKEEYSMEELKENYPGSCLFLNILDEL